MCIVPILRWIIPGLSLSLIPPLAAAAQAAPADYDDFVIWDSQASTESLQEFILEDPYVFIPSGTHEIDNPVIVATAGPLFIHGDGRNLTTLVAADPTKPLFEIVAAMHVGFANLRIEGKPDDTPFTAFRFLPGPEPLDGFRFDLQDTLIRRGGLVIEKAGSYYIQATTINGARSPDTDELLAGIRLDHPGAELSLVGGKILSTFTNIHQIAGHLQVHGTLFNSQRQADILLTSPSPLGAHFVVGTRTEGTHDPDYAPYLVRVPPTPLPVDIVVKGNEFTGGDGQPASPMIDYNAAGTLWVLGNNVRKTHNSHPPGDYARLVDGIAPLATIVGIGNQVVTTAGCPADLFPVVAGSKLTAWNRVDERSCSGWTNPYNVHFPKNAVHRLPDFPQPPQLPTAGQVPLLKLPRMNTLIGDLIDVRDLGATPNDASDDWSAIQNALSERRARLYFPPGTYRITKPLRFDKNSCPNPLNKLNGGCMAGGRIVGAGSEVTVIHNVSTTPDSNAFGQVFEVRSLSNATVQGLTLKTDTGKPDEAKGVFHLGDDNRSGGVGFPSTVSVNFYDMVFDGGDFGLGILLDQSSQADATLCVHCEFRNAKVGFVNGGGNAINNMVHAAVFKNNEISVAQGINTASGVTSSGGSVRILSGRSEGTTVQEFSNFLHRVFYVHDFVSSAPQLASQGCNHKLHLMMIDNSELNPTSTPTNPYLNNQGAPQILFLDSQTPTGTSVQMDITNCGFGQSETSMLSLFSDIGGFNNTFTTPGRSYIDRID